MEQILITGASGFLGRRAAEQLGRSFRILAPSHRELDVTHREDVRRYLALHRPDAVLHCAAISDTGRCSREPELARRVNVDSCIFLAEAAGETGSRCLLCSSDQVYFGSPSIWPHREEESPLSPANLYGQLKLEAEHRCLAVNPDCVLLRLSWMYDRKTLSPAEHGDFFRTLLARLAAGEPISLPLYDRRGITDVREVVRNLERALLLPGGVWNFGSDNSLPTYVLMQRVFQRLGLGEELLLADEVSFADSPRNLSMDPRKTRSRGIFFSSAEETLARNLYPFYHR